MNMNVIERFVQQELDAHVRGGYRAPLTRSVVLRTSINESLNSIALMWFWTFQEEW